MRIKVAERQGFEPWVRKRTTVFETAPFDHSGTSPSLKYQAPGTKANLEKPKRSQMGLEMFGNFGEFALAVVQICWIWNVDMRMGAGQPGGARRGGSAKIGRVQLIEGCYA